MTQKQAKKYSIELLERNYSPISIIEAARNNDWSPVIPVLLDLENYIKLVRTTLESMVRQPNEGLSGSV